uniref:Integrase catalytic domain-containing protein n=1 Tax=Trichuris muris TaxID=70415 RepID=A0A5S6QAY4_TRIMR
MGHPGVRRTLYFVKRINPMVSKRQVRQIIMNCDACQSIDPAPVKWRRGCLSVERVWQRLAMDITHCGGRAYLTLIDSGPSRFPIWRPLKHQSSANVVDQLESVFFERGAPEEILADNDTTFRSQVFEQVAAKWDVRVRCRSAHYPAGNSIVERCHRTVKVIVARKGCSVHEAVHLYNIKPRDDCNAASAPANVLYSYQVRLRGADRPAQQRHSESPYQAGDLVWTKPPGARCNTQYQRGAVTGTISDKVVEVDGMPRHVRDLRRRTTEERSHASSVRSGSDDETFVVIPAIGRAQEVPSRTEADNQEMVRVARGSGTRNAPTGSTRRTGESNAERTDDQRTQHDTLGVPACMDEANSPQGMSRHPPVDSQPRRTTRPRRKSVRCPFCDYKIRGECRR